MPKRKRENVEERYLRKIRRLERKLKLRLSGSRSSSPSPISLPFTSPSAPAPKSTALSLSNYEGEVEKLNAEDSGAELIDKSEEILDDSIIKALGQTSSTEREYGSDIHAELVKRVENIITQGLKQDIKEELVKKYLIPLNAKLLDAPKLNKELQGLLNDAIKTRDKRVEERQKQIGVAIAALLVTTDKLIKDDVHKINLITTLSDVTRLLMDLHYQDTITRKKLIIPNLDKNVGKVVENQTRDEFLFGESFNDSVKVATAIKKSAGTILKQTYSNKKNIPTTRPNYNTQNYPKKQGNFRAPPPRMNVTHKQGVGGRYQTQHYSQKQRPPQRPPVKSSVRQT